MKLGLEGKAYYNSGSYGSPTWGEITVARDVTLNLDTETADARTRANLLWGADAVVKLAASVDMDILWEPTNAVFAALLTAFLAGTGVEILVLDGAVGTSGSRGLRATMCIGKFTRGEPLNGVMVASVSFRPTVATNNPAWYVV